MRSSDTPESEVTHERMTHERVPDWSHEIPSDDQLSQKARQRIAKLLRELAEIEQARQ